ncbi:MAG: c-type cytochrome [Rhodospirillaceae bacterium]|nr:c-type cytochrome [Rhodospirillaceae bacterium]
MKIHIIVAGIVALAVAPASAQTADVSILASTCSGCHGANADGSGGIPGLKGQQQAYIADQLKAFKGGSRPATVMNRLAKGYTDEEIAGLALHFSRLK